MLNIQPNEKCKNCCYCYITFCKNLEYYCTWDAIKTEEDDYCEYFKINNNKTIHIDMTKIIVET